MNKIYPIIGENSSHTINGYKTKNSQRVSIRNFMVWLGNKEFYVSTDDGYNYIKYPLLNTALSCGAYFFNGIFYAIISTNDSTVVYNQSGNIIHTLANYSSDNIVTVANLIFLINKSSTTIIDYNNNFLSTLINYNTEANGTFIIENDMSILIGAISLSEIQIYDINNILVDSKSINIDQILEIRQYNNNSFTLNGSINGIEGIYIYDYLLNTFNLINLGTNSNHYSVINTNKYSTYTDNSTFTSSSEIISATIEYGSIESFITESAYLIFELHATYKTIVNSNLTLPIIESSLLYPISSIENVSFNVDANLHTSIVELVNYTVTTSFTNANRINSDVNLSERSNELFNDTTFNNLLFYDAEIFSLNFNTINTSVNFNNPTIIKINTSINLPKVESSVFRMNTSFVSESLIDIRINLNVDSSIVNMTTLYTFNSGTIVNYDVNINEIVSQLNTDTEFVTVSLENE